MVVWKHKMIGKRRDRVWETENIAENHAKNYVTQFQHVDNGSNDQDDLLFRGHFDGFSTLLQYCKILIRGPQSKHSSFHQITMRAERRSIGEQLISQCIAMRIPTFLCRRVSCVAQNKLAPNLLQLNSPGDKQDALAGCKLTCALFPQLIGAVLAMIRLLSRASYTLKSDQCFVSRGGTTSVWAEGW